ncbi:hypothetical protein BSPWISOXPB_6162 [uncultured Gammaproteobacteria bacterium]|nr:hypothetical protein BSPWISOXPB_6162 [uncultured Gammaproteobacteria bacterium]
MGGAKVFEGASDKQVMAYFKQLTGSKLPKPVAKNLKLATINLNMVLFIK